MVGRATQAGQGPRARAHRAGLRDLKLDREDLAQRFVAARQARRAQRGLDGKGADPAMSEMRELGREFQQLAVARAAVAESQLQEVLCDFWINHFNIFLGKSAERYLLPSFVEETIRPRVLGRFEDLLIATAESPAMMVYLDNTLSVAPGSIAAALARARVRAAWRRSARADSMLAAARRRGCRSTSTRTTRASCSSCTRWAWTGATRRSDRGGGPGAHRLGCGAAGHAAAASPSRLGPRLRRERPCSACGFPPGRGREEGVALLRMLARNPATMLHVTTQLCQRLVSDDPPAGAIEAGVQAWQPDRRLDPRGGAGDRDEPGVLGRGRSAIQVQDAARVRGQLGTGAWTAP